MPKRGDATKTKGFLTVNLAMNLADLNLDKKRKGASILAACKTGGSTWCYDSTDGCASAKPSCVGNSTTMPGPDDEECRVLSKVADFGVTARLRLPERELAALDRDLKRVLVKYTQAAAKARASRKTK